MRHEATDANSLRRGGDCANQGMVPVGPLLAGATRPQDSSVLVLADESTPQRLKRSYSVISGNEGINNGYAKEEITE